MIPAVLAIDQGTSSTKALIFDAQARCLFSSAREVPLTYPAPGWVEQDPQALLASVIDTARLAISNSIGTDILAFGLANQGETVVMWNRQTGQPLYNAIGWQDRRTDLMCEQLTQSGAADFIREHTGLPIDPYFSATKLRWLLDNVEGARTLAEQGNLLAGTTDAWLLWKLTGNHYTDHTTASRTMLYNPWQHSWDQAVLDLLEIPGQILPEILPTQANFGTIPASILGKALPITAAVVDQQSALFGQGCYTKGEVKVTYGTGAFILLNTGHTVPGSQYGLIPTVAWALDEEYTYALDGGIYVAGAALQWLRDGLGIFERVEETAAIAASVPDNGDVFFVPALAGLAAPFWDSYARGMIIGLTRGTTRAHIVRAALEGIAFRTRDVLEAMAQDTGHAIKRIKVDGGASANSFLMQTLADLAGVEVQVAAIRETTALGAAFLAGLGAGLWQDTTETAGLLRPAFNYSPHPGQEMEAQYQRWQQALERAKGWASATAPTLPE
jgi:glycerol kinase